MDSQYEQAGAKKVFSTFFNHTRANVIAQLSNSQIGIANDVKAIILFDHQGNPYKTLQDESGAGTIPVNSVIVASANGRATSDTNFTFDGSTLRLPATATLQFGDPTANGSGKIVHTSGEGFKFYERIAGVDEEIGELVP